MHVMNIYAFIPGGVNRKNNNKAQGLRLKAKAQGASCSFNEQGFFDSVPATTAGTSLRMTSALIVLTLSCSVVKRFRSHIHPA